MNKKLLFYSGTFIVLLFFLMAIFQNQGKQIKYDSIGNPEGPIKIYLFTSATCPHCKSELSFLKDLTSQYDDIEIRDFEITRNSQNLKAFQKVATSLNADSGGVPFTIIGSDYFIGFSEGTTGSSIVEKIESCRVNTEDCTDFVETQIELPQMNITDNDVGSEQNSEENIEEVSSGPERGLDFSLPVFGEINSKNFSLPVLTIIIGLIDGFNPCAMWVLLFLISMLITMQDRMKRWILGSVFIITSGLVYFGFMALWLNLILFLGFVVWVRYGIGLIAIIGGGMHLRDGLNKINGCSVVGEEKRLKIIERMKSVVHEQKFILSLIGIMVLAFSVNLIELICSAGLPAVYTQILALNNLVTWQYYAYMSLYILIFIIDDLIVFIVAMKTLELTGLTAKYSKITSVIGGIIMILVGLALIFKPELIMFG